MSKNERKEKYIDRLYDRLQEAHGERDKLKKEHKELAEAAGTMLELLVKNAPIDGLYGSSIDEWDCLIKEALK